MRLSIASLSLVFAAASAFTTSPVVVRPRTFLFSSTKASQHNVPITITGTNIDLTPALEQYVNTKLERPLSKISGIKETECEVFLNVNKNPKVRDACCTYVTFQTWSISITHLASFICFRSRIVTAWKSQRTSRELPFVRQRRVLTCTLRLTMLPIVWYVNFVETCVCVTL
jgi:hypothetical protein